MKPQKNWQIIGIMLVKNEDLYFKKAVINVIDFCDKIIILDNYSRDKTWPIAKKLSKTYPKIKLFRIKDCRHSHDYVEKYANTNTWIFGVDGDEIYDPKGLKKLREQILNQKHNRYWRIQGHCFHCVALNLKNNTAKGYMAPPAKPVTKLYNFSLLESWREKNSERLHGHHLKFKPGFNRQDELHLFKKFNWNSNLLRFIHLSFIKRSSLEEQSADRVKARLNPSERIYFVLNLLRNLIQGKLTTESNYKLKKYKQGKLSTIKVADFFNCN